MSCHLDILQISITDNACLFFHEVSENISHWRRICRIGSGTKHIKYCNYNCIIVMPVLHNL